MTKGLLSPCIRQCTLDPDTNVCLGCFRTLEEILHWTKLSEAEKQAVLDRLPERRAERSQRYTR
jgi:predicted Fe-S protein YdhL (DUF1289 family)